MNIDRRIIFLLVALSLAIPLAFKVSVPPARMPAAEMIFEEVESIQRKKATIAFLALDFGPNTKAENEFQTELVLEHLMRRRIPVALFSLYQLASPFLESIPERVARKLEAEYPGQKWQYGEDWVNLGFRYGGYLQIQSIPKSDNLVELFAQDVRGNRLSDLKAFRDIKTVEQIVFLGEFTGLSGIFDTYVQFFRTKDYQPRFVHGCTSITIPEAFIYLESGQIVGLLEGIAGAAWYSKLLHDKYPKREIDKALLLNTGLGVAHLVVIALVVLGNILFFFGSSRRKRRGR